ncbi:ABC transporter ATP-binding protein [Flavobacterium muglaense]|uniref:ABC transporter ATP-binding protein n=1 Tax=Flavobacterium muglaense TaxID=2764716 RepID=A0A923SFB3_9FLAO|nr:ABC transporter ATP-binding protein [Flavobacterium muglaense]MBC5837055.1 ABC transporter ATP-binding protein [Flavobacterium muglaense]MBC5843584.1 ABC transporter ATP-binding protein [Flavobacterium muglaense]
MSKDIILKAENISKQYRLGQVGTGTLRHDLNRWWHTIRGKENPYLQVGDTNDRSTKGESEYVWALKDINFEVERGEVLGIIGKNGAGKSTLLKILSRVTAPTTGSIKFGGRVASLLEVGTGFNGEMTGRENIFLNGAILGMTKKEIASKIDEIIAFSGCERYIDTPVKRYSSGMTVRLAFAVAAFLEPEILIIDEVLAVGDAEFQKKAIGKMQDISKQGGRTVLFVSHNMAAVKSLCTRGIVLEYGGVVFEGGIDDCIEKYNSDSVFENETQYNGSKIIKKALLHTSNGLIKYNCSFKLEIYFEAKNSITNLVLGIVIKDLNDVELIGVNNRHYHQEKINSSNIYNGRVTVYIESLKLFPGEYKIDLYLGDSVTDIEIVNDAIKFTVSESFHNGILNSLNFKLNKVFHDKIVWKYNKIND